MIPIPLAQSPGGDNGSLLASIELKKQEEKRLAKQREMELLTNALGNTSGAITGYMQQKNQQDRAQKLAQLAAGGDQASMLQLGIVPPSMRAQAHAPLAPDQIEANEAARARGRASVPKPTHIAVNMPTPEEQAALNKAMSDGRLTPGQVNSRNAKILAQQFISNPNYDARKAQIGFKGDESGAAAASRFQESGDPQKLGRAIKSLDPILDELQKASDAFGRSDVRALNTIIAAFNKQYGTEAQSFEQFSADAKTLMSSIMAQGGVPHETMLKMMNENFPPNATPAQVVKGIANVRKIMRARGQGIMTRVSPQDFGAPSQSQPANTSDYLKSLGIPH